MLHLDRLPPFCPSRVHGGGRSFPLEDHPQAGAQCSPGGNPAAGAPPRVLTGQRIPGQLTELVAQTSCRYFCTDLGPSWLRKHSTQDQILNAFLRLKGNCLVLCPAIQPVLQDSAPVLKQSIYLIWIIKKILVAHQKSISCSLCCVKRSVSVAFVSYTLFPLCTVQCRIGKFSNWEKKSYIFKNITSSSGLLLIIFSLD